MHNQNITSITNMTLYISVMIATMAIVFIICFMHIWYIISQLYVLTHFDPNIIHQQCPNCYAYEIILTSFITNVIRAISYYKYRNNDLSIMNIFLSIVIICQILSVNCIAEMEISYYLFTTFVINFILSLIFIDSLF